MPINKSSFFKAQRRRLGRVDPSRGLFRTHGYEPDETGIATGDVFPDKSLPITISTRIKITGATPGGIIFELGSSSVGLAIWLNAATGKLFTAVGDSASDDGVTLEGPVVVEDQILNIVLSAIPSNGKARLWINGSLEAHGTAVGGELPNGWSDDGEGAVGGVEGTITTRVDVADRVALSGAQVVSLVSAYYNQRPRQFYEVS